MIEVKVPGKLVLFGEWAVLQGAPVIATALESYFYLRFEPQAETTLHIESPEENLNFGAEWPQQVPTYAWLKKLLDAFPDLSSGRLTLRREWALSEGLGSSSALFLGFLVIRKILRGENFTRESLWLEGQPLLQSIQGGGSGIDLATQIFGGHIWMDNSEVKSFPLQVPPELCLLHTGQKATTADELKKRGLNPEQLALLKKSVVDFGLMQNWLQSMESHARVLQAIGAEPEWVTKLREKWLSQKLILGLKTTGAGGGDALLVYLPSPERGAFEASIRKDSYWMNPAPWGAAAFSYWQKA